jgi:hypothetical protein
VVALRESGGQGHRLPNPAAAAAAHHGDKEPDESADEAERGSITLVGRSRARPVPGPVP